MACCVFTAYVMNRLIKACELLDLNVVKIQYNEFDDLPTYDTSEEHKPGLSVVSRFTIEGMTCTACVTTIEKALRSVRGVEAAIVSLTLCRASVAHHPATACEADICKVIEECGYEARSGTGSAQENLDAIERGRELQQLKGSFGRAITFASVTSMGGWLAAKLGTSSQLGEFVRLAVMVSGLWTQLIEARLIHTRAWRGNALWAPNMDTLISSSLLVGIVLSFMQLRLHGLGVQEVYWASGSVLAAVILGGRYVDILLKRQSSRNLTQLYKLQHEAAMVHLRQTVECGEAKDRSIKPEGWNFVLVPAMALRSGDEIRILAGSVVPCDCYITSGTSIVDQATMTGESLPVRKSLGDFLMSGTRNLAGELCATVSKTQDESSLEQLVASISTAVEGSVGSGTDVIGTYFVRMIILLAGFCAFESHSWTDSDLMRPARIVIAGERAMAILASACPCAISLAIPTAVISAISVATSRGVQLRGGYDVIKKLASISHIVMDKTGTLTSGQLSVSDIDGTLDTTAFMFICAAERVDALTHPIGRAVFQWALRQLNEEQRCLQKALEVANLRSELGKGVTCTVRCGQTRKAAEVCIGSVLHLAQCGIPLKGPSWGQGVEDAGIQVYIGMDGRHVASLRLRDTPRSTAASTMSKLRDSLSVQPSLLTGDSIHEAGRVAKILDIPLLAASALPHEKLARIKHLQASGAVVAMLGDGLNDAPALAAADVGILLSPGLSWATAAQLGVSNVVVTSDDLEKVTEAIAIARRTVQQVAWNWWWAILYNMVAVTAAAGAWEWAGVRLDASAAGMLMAGSSASVVGWSLWFRRKLAVEI